MLKGASKADLAEKDAREAWETGRRFFLFEAGSSFRSATAGVAEALETIETVGWQLEAMSHVWSSAGANHAVGFFLFRRP